MNRIPVCTNQGFKSLVPKSNVVEAGYLYWWFLRNRLSLEQMGRGATFKEVSKKIVAAIKIPLPPVEEQRRIVAILDAADDLKGMHLDAVSDVEALLSSLQSRAFAGEL